jgi:20S proteasome alpha/beta subunit
MTVIAYCDGVLASDSRCSDGADNGEVQKIWRLRNGYLFGGAGEAGFCALVRHWLERSAGKDRPKDRPEIYGQEPPCFVGLLIRPDGQCFILDHYLAPIEALPGPQAVGSGASHALTLMRVGYSAEQAVRAVIEKQMADGVGGAVQVLSLKARRKAR